MSDPQFNFPTTVYKRAWYVYLPESIVFIFVFILAIGVFGDKKLFGEFAILYSILAGVVVTTIFAVYFANKAKFSITLCQDGIFIRAGIFPWNRVVHHIKWRYAYASFQTNFVSWLFKSYKININQFTFYHIKNGHLLVTQINQTVGD